MLFKSMFPLLSVNIKLDYFNKDERLGLVYIQ